MNRIFQYFIDKKIAAILLSLFFAVVGFQCLLMSDFEISPDVSFPIIEIECVDYGARPDDIEKSFLVPIEAAICGIDHVEKVTSNAFKSVGTLNVQVGCLKNVNAVVNQINRELERIDLPSSANTEKPKVKRVINKVNVLSLALFGKWKVVEKYIHKIKTDLRNLDKVSKVETIGYEPYDFFIEVPMVILKKYDVSLSQIGDLIKAKSLSATLGEVDTLNDEIIVGVNTEKNICFYKNLELNISGSVVRLDEIADFVKKPRSENITRFDGKRAVIFNVYGKEAIKVSNDVKEYVKEVKLPVNMEIFSNNADILRSRLTSMLTSLSWAFVSVFLSLFFFLGLRSAVFSSIGVVVSFLGSFIILVLTGISVNMISLFAFIMVLGVVVDDAIIVSESIEKGSNKLKQSVYNGILKVYKPVFFATATSVVFFLLLLLSEGSSGKIIRSLAITAAAVLIVSLIEAFFCLPSHLVHFFSSEKRKPIGFGLMEKTKDYYAKLLNRAVEWRYVTIAIFIGLAIIISSLVAGGLIPTRGVDNDTSNSLSISFLMSSDTPFAKFKSSVGKIEKIGKDICNDFGNILKHTLTTISKQESGAPLSASITFQLNDVSERKISCSEIKDILREKTSHIEGYVSFDNQMISSSDEIKLKLVGSDIENLKLACKKIKDSLIGYNEILSVNDSLYRVARQIDCQINSKGMALGLTEKDIIREMRGALFGSDAGSFYVDSDEVRVKTRLGTKDRSSIEKLSQITIKLGEEKIELSEIADLSFVPGLSMIERYNGGIIARINISTKTGYGGVFLKYLENDILQEIGKIFPGIETKFDGFVKAKKEAGTEFQKIMIIGMFIMYAMLALLFDSFTYPSIAIYGIIFGLFGAIFGHMIFGLPLTLMSIYGMIAMSGVAINDSLVLIDEINEYDGGIDEAVIYGSIGRFRPIILTTVTTCISVLPILLFNSLENRSMAPIAASLFGGILASTSAALFLIPCLILSLRDGKIFIGNITKLFSREKLTKQRRSLCLRQ